MEKIALALGSNQDDRLAALRAAVAGLAPYVDVTAVSPVYETKPVYIGDQPDFLNAAVTGETRLAPLTLLWNLKQLEIELGRMPTFHYGPRLIDIDILFYGDQVFSSPELHIPHPRMAEREFVLRPLADIVPDWQHPESGLTVAKMLAALPESTAKNLGPLL